MATLLALIGGLIVYGLAKSHMLGTGKVRRLVVSEVLTAVMGVLLMALMLSLGVRDIRLLWPVAATALLCGAMTWVSVPRGEEIAASERREISKFTRLGVLGTLVSAGFLQGSVLLAAEGIGGVAAGQYAAAFALATPLSLVTTSVGLVLFPAFAEAHADEARMRHLMRRSLQVMVTLIVPVFLVVMFSAPEVTTLVWGDGFDASAQVLPILVCAVAFLGVGMPGSQALTSTGVTGMRDSAKIGLVGAGIGVATWLLAVPMAGVDGVALGYAVGAALTSGLPLLVMTRRLRIPVVLDLMRGWVVPIGAAAAAVGCIALNMNPIWRLVGLGFSIGTWAVLTLLQRRKGDWVPATQE
ncbi:hypothetical protein GCM10027020_36570 [Nocardioides salsibiostraticola]